MKISKELLEENGWKAIKKEILEENGWKAIKDPKAITEFELCIDGLRVSVELMNETNEMVGGIYFYDPDCGLRVAEVTETQIYKLAEELKKLEVKD